MSHEFNLEAALARFKDRIQPKKPKVAVPTVLPPVVRSSSIAPPTDCKRAYPDVVVVPEVIPETNKSVIRCILDQLQSGGDLGDILPLKEQSQSSDLKMELFPEMDEETHKELNDMYRKDLELRESLRDHEEIEDMAPNERPASPGAEYDKFFIPAEIGVAKPRFRANAHAAAYKGSMTETDHLKLISHAQEVERDLLRNYNKYKSPKIICKRMNEQYRRENERKRHPKKLVKRVVK